MSALSGRRPGAAVWKSAGRHVLAVAVAAVVGSTLTGLIYLLGTGTGTIDGKVVLPSLLGMGPLSLASTLATTLAAVAGAGILFGLLSATTRRPVLIFRVAASALALLSLSMPATIPGPRLAMRLTMGLMHVAVWAVSVAILPAVASSGRTRL